MPNGMYGGVRGEETKVGQKTFVSRPTRSYSILKKSLRQRMFMRFFINSRTQNKILEISCHL